MTLQTIAYFKETMRHPICRKRPGSSAMRFAYGKVRSKLTHRPMIVPLVDDVRMVTTPHGAASISSLTCWVRGLSEFEDMAFTLHMLQNSDQFVDVGANVGVFTLLATHAGASAIAFEPVPAAATILEENVRINGIGERVRLQRAGVGEQAGTIQMTIDRAGSNRVMPGANGSSELLQVPLTTLDEALAGAAPSMIKIDVEGFEAAVLRGGARTLASDSLLAVIVECNGQAQRYGFDPDEPRKRLLDAGFEAYAYQPWSRTLTAANGEHRGNNLFLRHVDQVRQRIAAAPHFQVRGLAV